MRRHPTDHNGMRFSAAPTDGYVTVTNEGGASRVVPAPVALRLFLQRPRHSGRPDGAAVAVVSFAVPEESTRPEWPAYFVCVSDAPAEEDALDPPKDWPRGGWCGPAPAWHTVPVGTWVALPPLVGGGAAAGSMAEEILARCARDRLARESRLSRGMEDRCRLIAEHGEQEAFTETLDYYTTLRVRYAFLCWNARSLGDRLAEVRARIERHRSTLLATPPETACAAAAPPATDGGEGEGVHHDDDPNALCVPQPHDYDLCPPGADDRP